jgi:Protein of unknown function (DUF3396)
VDRYLLDPTFIQRFIPKDEAGYDMASLAFYFSFRFPDGYRTDARRRAAEVARDYCSLCGRHLRWMTSPLKCLWQPVPNGYTMDDWLSAYPKEDWVWQMLFHSGRISSEAATYQIAGLGDSTQTYGYSNLFLFVPITWFAENAQDPIALYLRWSQMLEARHGTAGLGLVPPEDTPKRDKTWRIAAAFGKQFPGIELADSLGNQNVFWGLLSANWLNMVDSAYVEQLGGVESIRARLAAEPLGDAIGLHPFDGGLILSAGDAPDLCDKNEAGKPPLAYGPVARLLKPLRTTKPWGCWGCDKDESLDWLARFDGVAERMSEVTRIH